MFLMHITGNWAVLSMVVSFSEGVISAGADNVLAVASRRGTITTTETVRQLLYSVVSLVSFRLRLHMQLTCSSKIVQNSVLRFLLQ
jgi:hypothetical protein